MHRLFPHPSRPVDPVELVESEHRDPSRPWLVVSMIASVDGAIEIDGRSGGLGGPPDRRMFLALRSVADAIVVAAGTVRDEDYGAPSPAEESMERRRARGQAPAPRLVVVTSRLDLDPRARLFADGHRPVVVTHEASPAEARDRIAEVADLVVLEGDRVQPPALVQWLGAAGYGYCLAEGGPAFNAALFGAGVVDEVCVTIAPTVVGGTARRLVWGGEPERRDFHLDRVAVDEGFLFLRYLGAVTDRR